MLIIKYLYKMELQQCSKLLNLHMSTRMNQEPIQKFVNIKKINDAETAPINLKNILFLKNFVTKPIIRTLPHVKK